MSSCVALTSIAVIGGVTVALQGQFMGLIDMGLGIRESVFKSDQAKEASEYLQVARHPGKIVIRRV